MRISALAAAAQGASSAPGTVSVTEAWGAAPGRQFRAARYLAVACGSLAEGLSVDAASVALRGEFLPLDYDALHPPGPLVPAEPREDGDFLVVDLGGVRRVRRVVLARSEGTRSGTLELYRLDGERPAAVPTVTVASGRQVIELESRGARPVAAGERMAPAMPKARAAAHAASPHAPHEPPVYQVEDTVVFELDDAFDDARFALAVTNDGAAAKLGVEDLLSVGVRSAPRNSRLGLAAPQSDDGSDPLADLLLVWPDPTSSPSPLTTQVDAGALLSSALTTHLDRRVEELRAGGAALPARVDVGLVVAADAPCRFRFDVVAVEYHLERASLDPPEEKVVLRFAPDRPESWEVTTVLPRGAHVVSAQLGVSESRIGAGAGSGSTDVTGPFPAPGGLAVTESGCAAQRLDLADPVVASGLALGLLPLAQGTELVVEVRADAGGSPAGQRLASGFARLGTPGSAQWAGVGFGEAVLVPSGPVWVLLRAARGRAVWLTGTLEAGVEATRVFAGAEEMAVLRGAQALCSLRPAKAPEGAEESGVRLHVEGVSVPPGTPAQGRVDFDCSAALNEALGHAGGGADPVPLGLRFSAELGTLLTVYPPRIKYDL